jgi:hypothetical protein
MTLERIAVIGSRLVGGHRIGIDTCCPTSKAEAAGYHPGAILAGRRINDNVGVREPRSFGTVAADRWSL